MPSPNDLEAGKKDDDKSSTNDDTKPADDPLASVGDVFSFAHTFRIRLYIFTGLCCAVISGCVFPAMAWFFSQSFVDLSADAGTDAFMKEIRRLAYSFLILG